MATRVDIKVADEVWVAAALLHRERRTAADFSAQEILERARQEGISDELRPGVYVHIVQHCVANRAPNPGRYRMLVETSEGRRRLYRIGDTYHPQREGGKMAPNPEDIPKEYGGLLNWYSNWSADAARNAAENDPLLKAQGSGKHLWA